MIKGVENEEKDSKYYMYNFNNFTILYNVYIPENVYK